MALTSVKVNLDRCIVCLNEDEEMHSIFEFVLMEDEIYAKIINRLCAVQISSDDGKPKMICAICADISQKYLELKNKYEYSNDILNNEILDNSVTEIPIKSNLQRCRICLTENEETISLGEKVINAEDSNFLDVITKFFKITASSEDNKPQLICIQCANTLRNLEEFNKKFKESDNILNQELSFSLEIKEKSSQTASSDPLPNTKRKKPSLENPVQKVHIKIERDSHEGSNLHQKDVYRKICNICGIVLMSKKEVTNHKKRHVPKKTCRFCDYKWSSNVDLSKHISEVHGTKGHKCPKCGKIILSKNKLRLHIKGHTYGVKFRCEICEKIFNSSYGLKYHTRKFHVENNRYSCIICCKQYRFSHQLKHHKKSHAEHEKSNCRLCNITFKTVDELERHYLNEHLNTQKSVESEKEISDSEDEIKTCDLCGWTAEYKEQLRGHKEYFHECKICKYCDYKNIGWNELIDHIRKKHPNKGHLCGVCDIVFLRRSSLTQHLKSHTVRPKIECIICNSSFTNSGSYKLHLNGAHNSVKPFACVHCKKTFKMAEDSKSHRIEHVYKSTCETCEKSFTSYDKLLMHFVEIHKGEIINQKGFVSTEKIMYSQSENVLFMSKEAVLERPLITENSEDPAKNSLTVAPKIFHEEATTSMFNFKKSKMLVKGEPEDRRDDASYDMGITKQTINLWKNSLAQSLQEHNPWLNFNNITESSDDLDTKEDLSSTMKRNFKEIFGVIKLK